MRVGYIRVSSTGQNTDRQEDLPSVERVFTDKASGGSTDRPAFQEMLAFVREGDVIVGHSLDRVARSLLDLEKLVADLNARGVGLELVKERMSFMPGQAVNPMETLMRQVLGAFAQFERALIKERQREGIEKAKAKGGVYKGRQPSIDRDAVLDRLDAGQSPTQIARELGVSRPSVYRIANERANA